MKYYLKIDRIAVHYVDAKNSRLDYAPDEQDVAKLHSKIQDFFLELVTDVWDEQDTGSVGSARFVLEGDEGFESGIAKSCIDEILKPGSDFFTASKELARHLYKVSPSNASAGLLVVIRLTCLADGTPYVALLKIRHKDESFVRALGNALTQLEVEHVQNMLLREIQKGAISPHPIKKEYDLKVVDKVTGEEPSKYFIKFLGCQSKQSDEHQVKKLLPSLEAYAESRRVPFKKERLHRVVSTLLNSGNTVSTSNITEAVAENRVFGARFDEKDFEKYLRQESDIGPVDIPPESFAQSGKTAKSKRNITIRFREQGLEGLTIRGRPEIFESIVSTDGDKVIFRVQTTRDGYSVIYE